MRGLRLLVLALVALAVFLVSSCGPVRPEVIISGCVGNPNPREWVGRVPLSLCMSARMSSGGTVTLYEWDFGDGASSTGVDVNHTYPTPGDYTVTLTCTYADGERGKQTALVSAAGEPVAAFTASEYKPFSISSFFGFGRQEEEDVLEFRFDARDSYPKESSRSKFVPVEAVWDFGDGTVHTVVVDNELPWVPFGISSDLVIRHLYAAAGIYTVTLTLTDSLGYTDTATQTITVGTPNDDDEEDLQDGFELTSIFWAPGDEEEGEGGCLSIYGTVQNNNAVAAGVKITATAYDAQHTAVGTFSHWPAGATNIGAGIDYAFGFFLCELSVPVEQVVDVEVVITDAVVY